ncbi:MAG TPA: SET domain-containing protein-lysine N-methyltransferase [Candidatus Sulfotelmatobacter sp.]|nr:SET domain-containing protein-lysine N-methyltransferase [Candidatus Sulfotelmatobacter sp.]
MIAESSCSPSPLADPQERSCAKEQYSTESYYIDKCEVGLGVFANRDIARDEVILGFGGPLIDFAETKRRGPWECMAIQIGPDRYIDTRPPGVFVNHSCDPNAGIREDRYLVALREIQKGEEIRFDYSTTMEEQSFTMRCLCGAPECRHLVTDFSTLPPHVKERYIAEEIVMSFILQRNRGERIRNPKFEIRNNLESVNSVP